MKWKYYIIVAIIIIVVIAIIYNSGKKTGELKQLATTPSVTVLNPYDLTTYAKTS